MGLVPKAGHMFPDGLVDARIGGLMGAHLDDEANLTRFHLSGDSVNSASPVRAATANMWPVFSHRF